MGTEFILAFPDNYGSSTRVHLYIVSTELTFSGNISSPYPGVSKSFSTNNGSVTLNLPDSLELPQGKSNKIVSVKTSRPVAVFGMDHSSSSGEAFYVYPKQKLGLIYGVVSALPYKSKYPAYIVLIGTSNQTQVTITLNTTGRVSYNGRSYSNGERIIVTINEMESIQLESNADLSGSRIQSTKPIAVISGNVCSNPFTVACNQFIEYLIPTGKCGKTYIVPPVKGTKKRIRVIPSHDATAVSINGGLLKNFSPQRSEVDLDPDEMYTITSDHSICVYLFLMGSHSNPAMTFLPPVERYVNDIVFPKPIIQVFSNYISVVAKSSTLPNLRLNNNTLSNNNLQRMSVGSTEYSTFWVALPNDTSRYHLHSTSPGDVFGAIVYGYKHDEAYGYPAAVN